MALWPLFSTTAIWGVGVWLRDAGRGLQKSPESRGIAVIARDRKTKISPLMNTDDTDQEERPEGLA
jgi:hypothetical protein